MQSELEIAKNKAQLIQQNIEQLTGQYGKEIAALKAKLAEQNAQLVLGMSANISGKSPIVSKFGVPRKEKSMIKSLDPIQASKIDAALKKSSHFP